MKIRNIAVLVSGIDEEYPYRLIQGINDFARSHDLNVSYFAAFGGVSERKEFDIGEYSIYKLPDLSKFDGILVLSNTFSDIEIRKLIINRVKAANVPVVIFECSEEESLHDISTNNYTAMKSLVEHLIKVHGAKTFNYISGSPNNPEAMDRYRAFRDALAENDIEFDENRLFYGFFRSYDGIKAIEAFKESGLSLPDAFVCANDGMALTAMNMLQQMGYRIPEDVMITGFDCTFNAINACPSLTTIKRPLYYSGEKACEILFGLMNKEDQPMRTELHAEPVFSESCGCFSGQSEDMIGLKKIIYDRYEQIYSNVHMLNRLIAGLAGAQKIEECFGALEQMLKAIDCNDFCLCLVNNWENTYNVTALGEAGDQYALNLVAPFIWKDGKRHPMRRFPSRHLRPDALTSGGNISYYIPLHFNQRCLGYYIITNNDFPINSLLCHTMTLSLGNAIDNISKLNILDPLCRIYNRNGFNKNAEYLFKQCKSASSPVTVCFVDMDGLKGINDTYGHQEGDFAIKSMADAISVSCGTVNICGRFGGDEFVIFGTGAGFAEQFKKRLMTRLATMNRKLDKPYKLSASLGYITTVPKETDTLLDLIQQADEKMYEVKKENKMHRI